MNPARKRNVRLVVALSAAVLLASALMYTSFSAASPALTPSELIREAQVGHSYELTGVVAANSVHRLGATMDFSVQDRVGARAAVPVSYSGEVPDPFRVGREIIVTVSRQGGAYIGQRDSLTTKCPSKFTAAPSPSAPPRAAAKSY